MTTKRDYYEILEISKTSSNDDIKRNYRKLAKKFHPDANPNDVEAENKFKEISEAYTILSDPEKKLLYDRYGHDAFNGSAGASKYSNYTQGSPFGNFSFDINDLFNNFYSREKAGPTPGTDIHKTLKIKFEEAIYGITKTVHFKAIDICDTCTGTGAKSEADIYKCMTCNGTGQERLQQSTLMGIRLSSPN